MRLILSILLVFFLQTQAMAHFMPDNDLWREDCIDCAAVGGIDQEMFNKISDAGYQAFKVEAEKNGERLVINKKWTDSTVNANCCRGCKSGEVTVNMYGGLARRSEVTAEGFALVLAHELSHAYGGEPYYPDSDRMSGEGQSDYAGAKIAFKKIAALVPELQNEQESTIYIKGKCNNNTICENTLIGGLSLGELLAKLSGNNKPEYETPDPTIVIETEISYPKTTQCRLDTYRAGALGESRPACWFKSGEQTEPTPIPTPAPTPTPEPTPIPEPIPSDSCYWCWDCFTFHCDWEWPW